MIQIIHRYEIRNNIPQIVLYCYTPVEYEFATDFHDIKNNAIDTATSIRDYVQKHFPNVQNQMAMIIVNGVILGTTAISNILTKME